MNTESRRVQRTYLTLTLLNTLATSLIWGINTLFLLDAGLSNTQAFAANAFFTAGQLLFEVPTGVVADSRGRRTSFLLGALTLGLSTAGYLYMWEIQGPFWGWALSSVVLGLGYTFFSGAVEAWLVDALHYTKFKGNLDNIFAKGQVVSGIAMLSGSVAGGIIAQASNLGVPYIARAAILGLSFIVAFMVMRDIGFTPEKSKQPIREAKKILDASIEHGIKNRKVRWIMLSSPFMMGISFYVFYAMQPYLLKLYGNPEAYSVAGLVAAIVAGAQILGGTIVPKIIKIFDKRTTVLLGGFSISALVLVIFGFINSFPVAIGLIVIWAMIFATSMPVRQAYINGVIPSKQRATVLSFDSMIGSGGGVIFQPALGKVADVYSYSASYMVGGIVSAIAVPFVYLARKENSESDPIKKSDEDHDDDVMEEFKR
ncbi:MAG TPA: MFS transporter [Candidatus Saccharimonadales bacterium]|nr:MFS transporter [Candidatus Saccharimonadales bacterium]